MAYQTYQRRHKERKCIQCKWLANSSYRYKRLTRTIVFYEGGTEPICNICFSSANNKLKEGRVTRNIGCL